MKRLIQLLFILLFCTLLSNCCYAIGNVTKINGFVLTNEDTDRLIERLESAGCKNLYDCVVYIRNQIEYNAPLALVTNLDVLLGKLNKLGSKGEVFTLPLSTFRGSGNTPVVINPDGTIFRKKFSIYKYLGSVWIINYVANEGMFLFTTNPEYFMFIDSVFDANWDQTRYYAFGMAWGGKWNSVSEDNAEDGFRVYPNPATEYIEITQPSEGFEPSEGSEVRIYNALGECVMVQTFSPSAAGHRMNIDGLPRGAYFLTVGRKSTNFVIN